jgi:hypothetical protein
MTAGFGVAGVASAEPSAVAVAPAVDLLLMLVVSRFDAGVDQPVGS